MLGENIHDRARYVTWECTGGNNYFWGHYFTDKEAATKDFYDRVEAEVAYKRSIVTAAYENMLGCKVDLVSSSVLPHSLGFAHRVCKEALPV